MSLLIHFTKMHALGNDFVILDNISQFVPTSRKLIRYLAHRHFGIGCDQVLLIDPPSSPQYDFFYRIFNRDGREVEQCGNGARCVARYLKDSHLVFRKDILFETLQEPLRALWDDQDELRVELNEPKTEPADIPIVANRIHPNRYEVDVNHEIIPLHAISMGNPHATHFCTNLQQSALERIGRALQKHSAFPEGVNVGFCQILARNHIKLRVFERGVGETLACGSGAAAAVASGVLNQTLSSQVRVDLPGGSLTVQWQGKGHPLYLSGPTSVVYRGEFVLSKPFMKQRPS
jgi:diaminopimelate epimerase